MKKISLAAFAAIIAMVFSVTSCKKMSDNTEATKEFNSKTVASINGTNPFNYIGQMHNDALDEVAQDPNFSTLTYQEVYDIIDQFIESETGVVDNIQYSDIGTFTEYISADVNNCFGVPQDLLDDGKISSDVKTYLDDMMTASGVFLNQTLSGELTVSQVISAVQSIENDIISDYGTPSGTYTLTGIDMETNEGKATYLLMSCAILKYSYMYWDDVRSDPLNPWHTPVFPDDGEDDNNKPFWETKFGKVVKTVGKDLLGLADGIGDMEAGAGSSGKTKINIGRAVKGAVDGSTKK